MDVPEQELEAATAGGAGWRLGIVASITVRNLDEGLKRQLRIRAAENGRSMEQEVRSILRAALD